MPLFHVCLRLCGIVHLSQRMSGSTTGLGVYGMSMCQCVGIPECGGQGLFWEACEPWVRRWVSMDACVIGERVSGSVNILIETV